MGWDGMGRKVQNEEEGKPSVFCKDEKAQCQGGGGQRVVVVLCGRGSFLACG